MSDERRRSDSTSSEERTARADSAVPRKSPRWRLLGLLFGIALALLGLDVVTKSLAIARLEGQPPVELFGGALYLVLFRNPGAAFSIATGLTWVLALLAIVVIGVIIWFAPKLRSKGWAVGIGLILGGATGNLADRIFREPGPLRGHVIDFLSVLAPDGSVWPVFNLADSGIVCGGVLIVLLALLGYDYDGTVQRKKSRDSADEDTDGGGAGTVEREDSDAESERSGATDPERGDGEEKS
ncbi:signal peptidase II [Actinopolyspora saharensis]|uniref:Lipoprotein signal peptidase n=1 Tax=Actinopolyspora saharensis TaxID=995062 RepID=A0A1H1ARJ9_9ACTN|nr:signal peptidase II [Actinopolyspora saharensis]SDQ42345.1 signal peptidase II [Actinopolyspora saharensis]